MSRKILTILEIMLLLLLIIGGWAVLQFTPVVLVPRTAEVSTPPTALCTPSALPTPVIITAQEVTTVQGEQMLSLELHLNISPDTPPVTQVIYYSWVTTDDSNEMTTSFWRADVQDITHKQIITTLDNILRTVIYSTVRLLVEVGNYVEQDANYYSFTNVLGDWG